jgi:hypothetical protein
MCFRVHLLLRLPAAPVSTSVIKRSGMRADNPAEPETEGKEPRARGLAMGTGEARTCENGSWGSPKVPFGLGGTLGESIEYTKSYST